MSYTKETTVWCDHNREVPGAMACMEFVQFAGRVAGARKHAEKDGWIRIDGKDYCRHHRRFHKLPTATKGEVRE